MTKITLRAAILLACLGVPGVGRAGYIFQFFDSGQLKNQFTINGINGTALVDIYLLQTDPSTLLNSGLLDTALMVRSSQPGIANVLDDDASVAINPLFDLDSSSITANGGDVELLLSIGLKETLLVPDLFGRIYLATLTYTGQGISPPLAGISIEAITSDGYGTHVGLDSVVVEEIDGDFGTITVNNAVAVPEPSGLVVFLGLFGSGMVFLRRPLFRLRTRT